jgi:taurine transport system permease protein
VTEVTLAAPAQMPRRRYRLAWARRARRALYVFLFLGLWHVVTLMELVSPLFMPSPQVVFEAGVSMSSDGALQEHIAASLTRILKGFPLGVIVGVLVGALMGSSRFWRALLRPSVEFLRPVPALVWIPLVLIWFGISESGKVFLIAYGTFFIVVTNTYDAIRSADPHVVRAAQSLGTGRAQMIYKVLLPTALPGILTGMSVGMATAFSVLVAAELLGAISGLGWMISDARRFFRTDVVLLGMATIGVLGFLFVRALVGIRRRLLPWHAQAESE